MIEQLSRYGLTQKRGRLYEIALGALGALGFAPFYLAPITLFVLALLTLRLYHAHQQGLGRKRGFMIGFAFGFGFFLAGLYWIGAAFTMRPGYLWLMPPLVGGLVALLATFWGAAAAIAIGPSHKTAPIGVAPAQPSFKVGIFALSFMSLLFIAEWLRGHVFGGLPWNLPAYIIKASHPLSQISSLIGVYGQSLLILIATAFCAQVIGSKSLKTARAPMAALVIGTAALWLYGMQRLNTAPTETYHSNARLRLVTVDFNQKDKFDPAKDHAIVTEFIRQSISPGFEDVTHVIWPEGALDGFALDDASLLYAVGHAFSSQGRPPPIWIFNSIRTEQKYDQNGKPRNHYYSSIIEVTFDETGIPTLSNFSDKTRLVPFGEYIPFHRFFESFGIETLTSAVASFSAAKRKEAMALTGLPPVAPLICYEGIFPDISHNMTGDPTWSLILSNDGWYGRGTGPYQHANQNRYRAIETGRALIRASSGGESGLYNQMGEVINIQKSRKTGVLDVLLPKNPTYHYNFLQFPIISLLISLFISIYAIVLKQKKTSDLGTKEDPERAF